MLIALSLCDTNTTDKQVVNFKPTLCAFLHTSANDCKKICVIMKLILFNKQLVMLCHVFCICLCICKYEYQSLKMQNAIIWYVQEKFLTICFFDDDAVTYKSPYIDTSFLFIFWGAMKMLASVVQDDMTSTKRLHACVRSGDTTLKRLVKIVKIIVID